MLLQELKFPECWNFLFCLPVRLILTAAAGIVGGLLLVVSWWRFGSVLLCMFVIGLVLGFLFSATLFFTPVGKHGNPLLGECCVPAVLQARCKAQE